MNGHMKDGKFHPHTQYQKGTRKSRDQSEKTEGIRLKRFDRFEKAKIQTLIFPPSWSFSKVRSFLKRNDFKATKVVKEGNRIRARQFPPSDIKRGGDCRTISLGNSSVQAVLCEVPVTRKSRDVPTELQAFKKLDLIDDKDVRNSMISTLTKLRRIFVKNDMDSGILWSFLEDTVNGQIEISLDKDDKDHYTNKLGDFYIDSRVGFNGVKEVNRLVNDLRLDIMKIVKYDKPKFVVGDIVKPDRNTGNVVLRDNLKEKPDITYKIAEMTRNLDPHYIGYQIVDVDKKPFKKNWVYAGSDNLVQGELL